MRGKGSVVCAAAMLWSGAVLAQTALEAVSAADRKFEEAFNRGDAAAVAAMYTTDGAVLPPGQAAPSPAMTTWRYPGPWAPRT